MRTLRLAAASALLVVFGVGAWAGVYAYKKGFSKKWRRLIMEEFDRRGIEAEIGKLTIDPFEGLVARDVKLYADPQHRSVLASMDNITLDIDFAKLLRKQQFLNTIEFRDADIAFPTDPDDPAGERLEITNFSARVRLPENKIEIDRAECDFHGVHISLVGSLLQPKPKPDAGGKDELARQLELMKKRRAAIARVVAEIGKFQLGDRAPPHLHLEIIGDLETPETIEATARLTGRDVGRGRFRCNSFDIRAEYRHPDILIDQINIVDDYGELYADAHWRIGTEAIPFNVESSIDSHNLLRSLFDDPALGEVVFFTPPRIGAAGEIYFGTKAEGAALPMRLVGTIECEKFTTRGGQIFSAAYAEFSVDPTRWYLRKVSLDHKTGSAVANALYDRATGIRYDARIDMDPTVFTPLFRTEQTQDFLRRFQFDPNNPVVSIAVAGEGPSLDQRGWTNEGEFTIGPCLYRDIPLLAATGRFQIKGTDMVFSEFHIRREEGHIEGERVHVRGEEQLVEVHGIESTVFPAIAARYFAPKTALALERYRFLSPPRVTLEGVIDSGDGFRSKLVATFETDGPASFDLFGRELPITGPVGTLTVDGEEIGLEIDASMLHGRAQYRGTFGIGPRRGDVTGDLTAEAIDFGELVALYEIPTETRGTLAGQLQFAVPAEDRKRWSGSGAATLKDGDVFAIPVMGPLSRLISGVLDRPKAGYSVATEASASFVIDRGVIHSGDFVALTPGFVLRLQGDIDPVADQLDIDAEMNARGPLRIVGWPLSKLLRYKGEGALSKPQWRPVNFTLPRQADADPANPGDPTRLSDVVTAVPKATVGVGSKAIETGARAIGAGAKALGNGALGVGSKARDLIPIPRLIPRKEAEPGGGGPAPAAEPPGG